jgi:hypothetical protein
LTPPLRPRCRCLQNVPNGKTVLRHRDGAAANNVVDGRPPMCRPRESSLAEKGLSLAYTAHAPQTWEMTIRRRDCDVEGD